jgi:CheY-like chemotaxis protein
MDAFACRSATLSRTNGREWFLSTSLEVNLLPKRPRVLIGEDHPGMAKAVSRLLALDCDVVGHVADGNVVVEAAQRLQPDVIVVDVNLPNVNGLEACRRITELNLQARVSCSPR